MCPSCNSASLPPYDGDQNSLRPLLPRVCREKRNGVISTTMFRTQFLALSPNKDNMRRRPRQNWRGPGTVKMHLVWATKSFTSPFTSNSPMGVLHSHATNKKPQFSWPCAISSSFEPLPGLWGSGLCILSAVESSAKNSKQNCMVFSSEIRKPRHFHSPHRSSRSSLKRATPHGLLCRALLFLVLLKGFKAMNLCTTVSHVLLQDLVKMFLQHSRENECSELNTPAAWAQISNNKGHQVPEQRLRKSCMACYPSTNQLLISCLSHDVQRQMSGL